MAPLAMAGDLRVSPSMRRVPEHALDRFALKGLSKATFTKPTDHPKPGSVVSVVVPCYNYGHYLPGCVESIVNQPFVDVEVIIVDDASPDGSVAVAHALAAADSRVRVIAHAQNKGHIATYNDGLAEVTGDYAVLLSADDLLVPGALARAVALMQANPEVGLTYGHARSFSADVPVQAATEARTWVTWRGYDWLEDRCRTGRNALISPEAVMRTDVLKALGGYNAHLPHAGDFEMWMRAATMADVGYVGGVDQAWYRVHAGNMHLVVFDTGAARGSLVDLEQRLACFASVLGSEVGRADAQRLLGIARRTLAREALTLAVRSYEWGKADAWPVEELAAFAERTFPPERMRPLWRALALRRRFGPRRSRRHPLFLPGEQVYKINSRWVSWRWERLGV